MTPKELALARLQILLICGLLAVLSVGAHASPTLSFIRLFPGGPVDGFNPLLSFTDANGIIYGVTSDGGQYGWGTVFTLSPPAQNGDQWTETIVYNFTGGLDGKTPVSLTMDQKG